MSKSKPLVGRLVVVTRAKDDAAQFSAALRAKGARVYNFPTIAVQTLPRSSASSKALKNSDSFDYIIFTSAHAVDFFKRALGKRKLHGPKVIAVGPATAKAARRAGFEVQMMPDRFTAAQIARKLSDSTAGKAILLPRSAIAPHQLAAALQKQRANVTELDLYTAAPVLARDQKFERLLRAGKVDFLTFASPSSINGFSHRIKSDILLNTAQRIPAVCIGPSTARAAKKSEFKKVFTAKIFTTAGIIQTLEQLAKK